MIPYSRQSITNDDISAVCETLNSDIITCGEKTLIFEQEIAKFIGTKYAVVLNSATSALHVAYLCLNLGKNDEIITTPISFCATTNTAIMCGANVKFCDVKCDGNIDENKIESLITPKTKVIVPVDYGGNSVQMDKILQIAKKHNLFVLDDASHAFGAELMGQKVGSMADISVFSFHPVKPITTFEGGCICTNDEKIAKKAKLLRSHGIFDTGFWKRDMEILGYNYRLSDVACALGISQLKNIEKNIKKRENIAKFYDDFFSNCDLLKTIKIDENKKSTRHLYAILLDAKFHHKKEQIFSTLRNAKIGAQVHYTPIYEFKFYRQKYGEICLENAQNFYNSELSIPCHQLMSENDAKFVAQTLITTLKTI